MSVRDELIRYIEQNLVTDPSVSVDEETRLIDRGVLDSMGLMQLIMFIEERTGLRVPDDEVIRDNFQAVPDMVRLIDRLRERS